MATIATIRDGLQTRLATLDSPEVAAYDVATGRERLNNGLAVAIVEPALPFVAVIGAVVGLGVGFLSKKLDE